MTDQMNHPQQNREQRRAMAKARAHCAGLGHLDAKVKRLPSGLCWCTLCLCIVPAPLRTDGYT